MKAPSTPQPGFFRSISGREAPSRFAPVNGHRPLDTPTPTQHDMVGLSSAFTNPRNPPPASLCTSRASDSAGDQAKRVDAVPKSHNAFPGPTQRRRCWFSAERQDSSGLLDQYSSCPVAFADRPSLLPNGFCHVNEKAEPTPPCPYIHATRVVDRLDGRQLGGALACDAGCRSSRETHRNTGSARDGALRRTAGGKRGQVGEVEAQRDPRIWVAARPGAPGITLTGLDWSGIRSHRDRGGDGSINKKKETAMRKLVSLVFALGLLLGIAGSALAECGGSHTDTATPAPTKPMPQS